MNRKDRRILRFLGIEIGGKPLGRLSKEQESEEYREKMAKNVGERNEIEATFGTGKRIYRANDIRAKLPDTGESWTSMCYFAKNVMKFLRVLLHALFTMCNLFQFRTSVNKSLRKRIMMGTYTLIMPHHNFLFIQ